jgi:hypothetical protein
MNFSAKQYSLSANQLLGAPTEKVFPMLCPTCEYDWIETWNCELVFSKSGFAELDGVFTTNFPGDEKDVWVIDRYEPNALIQFVRVSESRVIRYRITLIDNGNGTTSATWEQTITALTETGNHYIESQSNEQFSKKIKGLEKLLNHYLETGEMLKTSN